MIEIWYKQLGFHNNPFSIKPAAYHDEVIGYEDKVKGILKKVNSGEVVFIDGDYGVGKTTILKRIINEFGGKKQIVYYSSNRSENKLNTKRLLAEKYGFFGKLFGKKGKNMILLLDESQELKAEDYKKLQSDYEKKNFKSIVLVGKDFGSVNLANGFKSIIGNNIVQIKPLTDANAIGFLKRRTGNLSLLPDDAIKMLNKKSNGNPRRLLKNTEEVCRYAVENFEDKVTKEIVEKVLA